jgi:hypothetical protein
VEVLRVPKVVTALKEIHVSMIIWYVELKENVSSVGLKVIPVVMRGHVVRIMYVIQIDSVFHAVGTV